MLHMIRYDDPMSCPRLVGSRNWVVCRLIGRSNWSGTMIGSEGGLDLPIFSNRPDSPPFLPFRLASVWRHRYDSPNASATLFSIYTYLRFESVRTSPACYATARTAGMKVCKSRLEIREQLKLNASVNGLKEKLVNWRTGSWVGSVVRVAPCGWLIGSDRIVYTRADHYVTTRRCDATTHLAFKAVQGSKLSTQAHTTVYLSRSAPKVLRPTSCVEGEGEQFPENSRDDYPSQSIFQVRERHQFRVSLIAARVSIPRRPVRNPTFSPPVACDERCKDTEVLQAPSHTVGFTRRFHTLSSIQATNTSLAVVPQSPVVHTYLRSRTLAKWPPSKTAGRWGCGASQSHQNILVSSLNVSETLSGERRSVTPANLSAVGIHGILRRGADSHERIVPGRGEDEVSLRFRRGAAELAPAAAPVETCFCRSPPAPRLTHAGRWLRVLVTRGGGGGGRERERERERARERERTASGFASAGFRCTQARARPTKTCLREAATTRSSRNSSVTRIRAKRTRVEQSSAVFLIFRPKTVCLVHMYADHAEQTERKTRTANQKPSSVSACESRRKVELTPIFSARGRADIANISQKSAERQGFRTIAPLDFGSKPGAPGYCAVRREQSSRHYRLFTIGCRRSDTPFLGSSLDDDQMRKDDAPSLLLAYIGALFRHTYPRLLAAGGGVLPLALFETRCCNSRRPGLISDVPRPYVRLLYFLLLALQHCAGLCGWSSFYKRLIHPCAFLRTLQRGVNWLSVHALADKLTLESERPWRHSLAGSATRTADCYSSRRRQVMRGWSWGGRGGTHDLLVLATLSAHFLGVDNDITASLEPFVSSNELCAQPSGLRGHGGRTVSPLASHEGEPGSIPAGSLDFRMWESYRTMPLVGGFSRGSPVSLVLLFRRCSILTSITVIGSQDLAVKSRPDLFTHILSYVLLRIQFSSPFASRTFTAPMLVVRRLHSR
ncbi:hypothetical protein PR048_022072 [Dryococelus australis]|uniref:Uncharacterized protein n=1 Tax=Dryococelus australis TaxID=614101 RepID=A0ABQ9H028_9NEOP|nr:hypothetical protein PR048_022072 [Dryococelus australis]